MIKMNSYSTSSTLHGPIYIYKLMHMHMYDKSFLWGRYKIEKQWQALFHDCTAVFVWDCFCNWFLMASRCWTSAVACVEKPSLKLMLGKEKKRHPWAVLVVRIIFCRDPKPLYINRCIIFISCTLSHLIYIYDIYILYIYMCMCLVSGF